MILTCSRNYRGMSRNWTQDLELDTLFNAMALGDYYLQMQLKGYLCRFETDRTRYSTAKASSRIV